MAMAVFVVANDMTALSVALPEIEQDFDSDVSTVQWVVSAYALVFGVLIVTGGRLADMLGRRRIFFIGAAIFSVFSVLGGAAQSDIWLIVCRALMGVGGAMMWPAVLGMTYDILPAERAALAGGLIIGSAGFGNAAGPLIGGALTDALSWRWILFINLPIAALACFVTWRSVPREPRRRRRRGHRRARHRHALGRPDRAAARARPGDRLGLDRPAHPRAVRLLRAAAGGLRADRAQRRRAGAGAARGDGQPRLPLGLPGHAADVGGLLRGAAVPAPVHAEDPGLHAAAGRRRAAADDGGLRDHVVHRRPALRAPRRQGGGERGRGLPHARDVPDLADRPRLGLGARSCPGWW